MHLKDLELLKAFQNYFQGIGRIYTWPKHNSCYFIVSSLEQIFNVVLTHFDVYSLVSQKLADYLLFKEAIHIIKNKNHLTLNGLKNVLAIRASMNKCLLDKTTFSDVVAVARPLVENKTIPDPEWLAGFTSGDGSFLMDLRKNSASKVGYRVSLIFQISQHSRDEMLMKSLLKYLDCGKYYPTKGRDSGAFRCVKFTDIHEKIIPFFTQHRILGVKSLDFNDWCKVAEIMKSGGHRTPEGLDKLFKLKVGINSGREIV